MATKVEGHKQRQRSGDDLEELLPTSIEVKVGEEQIKVQPIPFGHYPRAVEHIANIFQAVSGEEIDFAILSQSGLESVIQLIALATGRERVWFDSISTDEGLVLARAVLQVNRDFFVARVAPEIEALTRTLGGWKLSTPSSPPATAGAT